MKSLLSVLQESGRKVPTIFFIEDFADALPVRTASAMLSKLIMIVPRKDWTRGSDILVELYQFS
jgi:hypothetical protein